MSQKKIKLHDPFQLHIPNFILNRSPGFQRKKFTGFHVPHRDVINPSERVNEPKLLLGIKDEVNTEAGKEIVTHVKSIDYLLKKKQITKTAELSQVDKRKIKLYKDLEVLANELKENTSTYQLKYLNYSLPKNSEHFTSFNLIEKPYEKLDKINYYTITHDGVTYWSGSENYFVSLDEWQEQYKWFFKIIQIKSFLRFRLWKGFIVWLKTVKWKKFHEAKNVLERQCIICNVQLAEVVLRLQKRIYEYRTFNLIDTADDACISAIIDEGFYPIDEILIYPSVAKMREAMSYMDRAKKRTFCKFLSNFLTYCDYLVLNMLHEIMIQGFASLLNIVETHNNPKKPFEIIGQNLLLNAKKQSDFKAFFFVDLILKPDDIEISLPEDIATFAFKRLKTLWLDAMKEFENFTDDPFFYQFTKPSIMGRQEDKQTGVPPSLSFLLKTDAQYKENEFKIFDIISQSYSDINTFIMRYEELRNNYKTDVYVNPLTLNAALDITSYRDYATHYHKNITTTEKINSFEFIGIIKMQQTDLKDILLPVYRELLSALENFLIKLAMQKIDTIVSKAEEIMNDILQNLTENLTEKEKQQKFLKINEAIDNAMSEVDFVHDMFIIMKDFKMLVDDTKKESYMDCEDMVNTCRDLLFEKVNMDIKDTKEVENKPTQPVYTKFPHTKEYRYSDDSDKE